MLVSFYIVFDKIVLVTYGECTTVVHKKLTGIPLWKNHHHNRCRNRGGFLFGGTVSETTPRRRKVWVLGVMEEGHWDQLGPTVYTEFCRLSTRPSREFKSTLILETGPLNFLPSFPPTSSVLFFFVLCRLWYSSWLHFCFHTFQTLCHYPPLCKFRLHPSRINSITISWSDV